MAAEALGQPPGVELEATEPARPLVEVVRPNHAAAFTLLP
jgi:hypothetical protein